MYIASLPFPTLNFPMIRYKSYSNISEIEFSSSSIYIIDLYHSTIAEIFYTSSSRSSYIKSSQIFLLFNLFIITSCSLIYEFFFHSLPCNNTNTNSISNKSISVSNSMSLFLNTCITLRGTIPLDFFLSFFLITNSRFKFYRNENSSIVKRSRVRREEDRDCANGASHERVCVRSRNFRQAEKKVGRKEGARA